MDVSWYNHNQECGSFLLSDCRVFLTDRVIHWCSSVGFVPCKYVKTLRKMKRTTFRNINDERRVNTSTQDVQRDNWLDRNEWCCGTEDMWSVRQSVCVFVWGFYTLVQGSLHIWKTCVVCVSHVSFQSLPFTSVRVLVQATIDGPSRPPSTQKPRSARDVSRNLLSYHHRMGVIIKRLDWLNSLIHAAERGQFSCVSTSKRFSSLVMDYSSVDHWIQTMTILYPYEPGFLTSFTCVSRSAGQSESDIFVKKWWYKVSLSHELSNPQLIFEEWKNRSLVFWIWRYPLYKMMSLQRKFYRKSANRWYICDINIVRPNCPVLCCSSQEKILWNLHKCVQHWLHVVSDTHRANTLVGLCRTLVCDCGIGYHQVDPRSRSITTVYPHHCQIPPTLTLIINSLNSFNFCTILQRQESWLFLSRLRNVTMDQHMEWRTKWSISADGSRNSILSSQDPIFLIAVSSRLVKGRPFPRHTIKRLSDSDKLQSYAKLRYQYWTKNICSVTVHEEGNISFSPTTWAKIHAVSCVSSDRTDESDRREKQNSDLYC